MKSDPNYEFLNKVSPAVVAFGKIYNGFEAHGVENIPLKGPALLVFYHGLIPLDAFYFGLQFYLEKGRMIRGLADRWLFKTPVLADIINFLGAVPGDPETAVRLLAEGHLVAVSPGGVKEAIAGTKNNYKLLWGDRKGFARVALDANVDVIPAFTENVDELYRAPFVEKSIFQMLYEKTRWPIIPIMGLGPLPFPVKLKTWIGKPIPYDPNDTPETLKEKTKREIERLISEHQDRDPSVIKALRRRFGLE